MTKKVSRKLREKKSISRGMDQIHTQLADFGRQTFRIGASHDE